ncbi:hypothetical protein DUNSADRAFT_7368 [Dunaliella salina]|uniref:Encoded protein n=1 Tax=Dunaliella salina TaxID=3046 RepID=A0ABQ7H6A1_DUNSA|nr:hypothetical protein DUNSADRAFT_7368 [Dunaliella salina]|eukprot:KAF5842385.1 hypothetical protein DUNSADRAFT_7368 [Dunaliella salina]
MGLSSLAQVAPGARSWSSSSTPRDGGHAASLTSTSASNLSTGNLNTSTAGGRIGDSSSSGRGAAVALPRSILDVPLQQQPQQQQQGQVAGLSHDRRKSHGEDATSVRNASQRPPSPSLRPLSIQEVLRRPSPST